MNTRFPTPYNARYIIHIVMSCLIFGGTLLFSPFLGRSIPLSEAWAQAQTPVSTRSSLPRPDHIVIVLEENKGYTDIIGSPDAPYLNSLVTQGALLTNFYALHHPSQPNYLELFSGSNQGICNDSCATSQLSAPSLGENLIKQGLSFIGYAEDLPTPPSGSSWNSICKKGYYALKHCPWIYFKDIPASSSLDFTRFPSDPTGFASLPTVSFVIPNLIHDMHSLPLGFKAFSHSIPQEVTNGDVWLKSNLDAYVQWAKIHNSLLIVTWDEDSLRYKYPENCAQAINTQPPQNHIVTILVGAMVTPGAKSTLQYDHHDLLRTIEEMYGLPLIGESQHAKVITGIWK